MKYVQIFVISALAALAVPALVQAQDKRFESTSPTALEK